MKMKKTNRKMTKRSALMAGLIVAAITGVTPAFAASDNLTDSNTGKIITNGTTYIAAKSVTVTGIAAGKNVSLAVANGGKLHIGKGFNATPGAANSGIFDNPNTTLTTDNMTIESGGFVTISNNSTLKILEKHALVEGTLTLDNGTVDIMNGQGTLQIAAGASGGAGLLTTTDKSVNTVKGSVLLGAADGYAGTGNGKLTVVADSSLTITKDLTVKSGSFADVSGTLNVGGTTKSEDDANGLNGINIGANGMLVINNTSAVTSVTKDTHGNVNGAVMNGDLHDVGNNSAGTLLLRVDDGFTYTTAYLTKLASELGMSTKDHVGILGGKWMNDDGTVATPTNAGTGFTTAPSNEVKLTGGTTSGTILAASLKTDTATIANTGKLTLVGSGAGGDLVTGTATAITNGVKGTLTLGIKGEATTGILNTKITNSDATSTLSIEGGSFTITEVVSTAGTISATHSNTVIDKFTATGGTLFADPAFLGVNNVTGDTWGTIIAVGEGGNVAINSNEAWLNKAIVKAGLTPLNAANSVLGIAKTLKLTSAAYVVLDKNLKMNNGAPEISGIPVAGIAVQLGADSLLVADMAKLDNGTILKLSNVATDDKGKVTIDPTAKLYLDKLTLNNNNNLLFKDSVDNSAGITGKFGSILNPDIMLNASLDTPGSSKLTVSVNKASDVMPELSSDMDGLMTDVWAKSRNSVGSSNAGLKLVSRAANSEYMTPTEGARVVEGAARMAVVGATQQMAFAAANAATSAATQRTSMANPMANSSGTMTAMVREEGTQQWKAENTGLSAGNGMKNGAALWIMPLYQNMNAWNMKADNFNTGYSANFGGVALGGDYTFNDAFRVGLALNLGGGFAESNGDFAKTENKFNFWGINLYGGWAQNNFGVTADVGYTSTFNDVKQDTPANLGMSEFKTDMFSYAISAGLRGEYKLQTEYVDVIPHIAARFTSLHSDDYKIKSGGDTVFKGEAIDQSIWTFPIGVAFSKDVEMSNGWTFKPQVDLAVIPAAGDIAAKSKVKIPGSSVTADLESNIIDGVSYQGALGFDMYKDNIAFGLNYTIQASEHTTGHGVQATVRYEF